MQSAALAPAGSSIFRLHVGCTVCLPPPLSASHAVTWLPHRPVFHKRSHGRTIALRLLRFSSNCSHSWFRRTFVVTFFVETSHADVYPELLQDAVSLSPSLSLSLCLIACKGDRDLAILLNRDTFQPNAAVFAFHEYSSSKDTWGMAVLVVRGALPLISGTSPRSLFALSTSIMLWPRNAMAPLACSDGHTHTWLSTKLISLGVTST